MRIFQRRPDEVKFAYCVAQSLTCVDWKCIPNLRLSAIALSFTTTVGILEPKNQYLESLPFFF